MLFPITQLLSATIVNLLVFTNCPCIYSQAAKVPPALLSLILPAGQWLAFSWTSISRDHENFQLDLIILKIFSNQNNSMILFCVLPGASGLPRDKAAAGLLWLFPPCSSQPLARSSALWKGAETAFLMKHPW